MSDVPTEVVVTPRRSRAELVLVNVLALLLGVPIAASLAAWISPYGPPLAVAAALLLVAYTLVSRWNDRVELHPDRLIDRHAGRSRDIPLDDVVGVDVTLFDPRAGYTARQTVTVTVRPRTGAPVVVRGAAATVEPWLTALASALARRMRARLARGETLTFADAARFPLFAVTGVGLLTGAFALGLLGALRSDAPGAGAVRLVRFGVLAVFLGWGVIQSLRRWLGARKSRGLAVSSRGVVPLTELRPGQEAVAGYREAYGAAGPWVPWGEVVSSRLDGYGLTVRCAARAEPIALTGRTESLFVLDRLLTECVQRERGGDLWEPGTGVRVGAGEGGGVDEWEPSHEGNDARRAGR